MLIVTGCVLIHDVRYEELFLSVKSRLILTLLCLTRAVSFSLLFIIEVYGPRSCCLSASALYLYEYIFSCIGFDHAVLGSEVLIAGIMSRRKLRHGLEGDLERLETD